MVDSSRRLLDEVTARLVRLTALEEAGGLDTAIEMITSSLDAGGIVQAFGTGHSQAFAMEIAGRAGRAHPDQQRSPCATSCCSAASDPSILSGAAALERDPRHRRRPLGDDPPHPEDVFVIASNSGVNGSIVGHRPRRPRSTATASSR